MEDKKQYIYLGDTLEFKDIRLLKVLFITAMK